MSQLLFQQKLQQRRVVEERTEDLQRFIAKDKTLKENFKSDDRAVVNRTIREQREAAKEEYTAAQLQAAREAQERTHRLRAQDERLATELAKRKTEKVRQEMNVQRLVEQSEELRELESQLKQAYLNKEREVQIVESSVLLQKQQESDAEVAAACESERQRGLLAEQYRDYLRKQDGHAMKVALDEQMKEKLERRAQAEQEFLREKAEVDAVVAAIEAEDAREQEVRAARAPRHLPPPMPPDDLTRSIRREQVAGAAPALTRPPPVYPTLALPRLPPYGD
jgi:hypothetical protein